VPVKDDKKRLKGWIFPRFHQLDATRKLVAQVLQDGPGGKYLIQHSAGSGKTNSIAWTAHFLADLHDAANSKLFDTVLVVSDRTVLDKQLREAIESFAPSRPFPSRWTRCASSPSARANALPSSLTRRIPPRLAVPPRS
jgi:type I site-specific restriction-modification system R (restriction) subunit